MRINKTKLLEASLKELLKASNGILEKQGLEKVKDDIINCSIAAGVASIGTAWLPGAGAVISSTAMVASIWTMYVKINKSLNISLSEGILKGLAAAISTNLIAAAGSIALFKVASFAMSFVPGIGSLGAMAVDGMLGFVSVFASGIIYINLLTKVLKAKGNFEIEKEDIEIFAKEAVASTDVNQVVKEAKEAYKQSKSSGAFDQSKK